MAEQTFWVALGQNPSGELYAQSLIHLPYWRDSTMRAPETKVVIELTINSVTVGVSATMEKNTTEAA